MLPLVIVWTRRYSEMPTRYIAPSVGFALIVNHVLHWLLVLLPGSAYAMATALLPLVSALCWQVVSRTKKVEAKGTRGEGRAKSRHLGRFVLASIMINVALSLIYMLYRVPGIKGAALADFEMLATLVRVGLLVAIVLVFSVVLRFKINNFYRCIVVLGVFGFLAFPLLGSDNIIPYVLTAASFTCLGIVMWLFPIYYSSCNGVSSDYAIGLVYGPFVALWAMTYYFTDHVLAHMHMGPATLNAITLFGAGLVILAYAVVFTEREMSRAIRPYGDTENGLSRAFVDDDQVKHVADEYGLTEREREVFVLLFDGKSRAQIEEALCISEGTLNSHSRNIYKKIGVHNRQELVSLVREESFDR